VNQFEQEVIERLTRMEVRQEGHTGMLDLLNLDGCAKGHADRAMVSEHDNQIKRLWRYSRSATVPDQKRARKWGALGTIAGGAVIAIGNWLAWKWGGGQ
jgi:hypothetical protein